MKNLSKVWCGALLVWLCFAPVAYAEDQQTKETDKKEQKIEGPDLETSLAWIANFLKENKENKEFRDRAFVIPKKFADDGPFAISDTTLTVKWDRSYSEQDYCPQKDGCPTIDDPRTTLCAPCVRLYEETIDLRKVSQVSIEAREISLEKEKEGHKVVYVKLQCRASSGKCSKTVIIQDDFYEAAMKVPMGYLNMERSQRIGEVVYDEPHRSRDELMKKKLSGKPGTMVEQENVIVLYLRDGAPAKKLENAFNHVLKLLAESSKGSALDQDLF